MDGKPYEIFLIAKNVQKGLDAVNAMNWNRNKYSKAQ